MSSTLARRLRTAFCFGSILLLTGCFQSVSEDAPTPVNLTSIAPLNVTPTAFVTPLPAGGFVPATTDTPTIAITPLTVNNNALSVPTTATTNDVPTTAPILATPTALPTEGPCVHTVQPGEWFYSIARKFNISAEDLLAANPRSNPDSLQPGDVLNIPNCNKSGQPNNNTNNAVNVQPSATLGDSATPTPPSLLPAPTATPTSVSAAGVVDSGRVYTVADGDSLGIIARKFGVTVLDIRALNGLSNDMLSVGQKLKIPKPRG